MTAKLTYLFNLKDQIASSLTVDQISTTILFGTQKIEGWYNPECVYNEGTIVPYMKEDGTILMLQCIKSGATGTPIDLSSWREFSVLDSCNALKSELILLSSTRPTDTFYNKVWIRVKSNNKGSISSEDYNLIIAQNLILSETSPDPFTSDLVWGQITSSHM